MGDTVTAPPFFSYSPFPSLCNELCNSIHNLLPPRADNLIVTYRMWPGPDVARRTDELNELDGRLLRSVKMGRIANIELWDQPNTMALRNMKGDILGRGWKYCGRQILCEI